MSEKQTSVLVDAHGKPARAKVETCPRCGKGEEFRKPAGNFGDPFDHCIHCGHEYRDGAA